MAQVQAGGRGPRRPISPAGTALPYGPQPGQCSTVQNLNSSGERKGLQSLEEERGEEAEAEAEAEEEAEAEAMLRGGGSRASAKPRRPHSRLRQPSPPASSRRASGAAAAAVPESKEPSVLEAPVVSSVEETSFTFEFKRGFKRAKKAMLPPMDAPRGEDNLREGFSNKSNAVPVKKEAPKQVEFTHCSPGIVARLMGLDTVPRPKKVLDRCQSDTQVNLQRYLSGAVQEVACPSSGDQPCSISSDELPALKDVFEVTEMENMAMHELQPGNEEQCLRNLEADLEFVRQKFLDAKRLATDEVHRNSKEFSEALEILHSKKDAFLEILEENRTAVSGFSGHILSHSGGLHCSPHTSNIASAESSEHEILCSMAGVCDGMFDRPKEFGKLIPNMLLKETSAASVEPLAPHRGKSNGSSHCSQIVVLKPNLQRKSFTPVVSSQEASKYKKRGAQHSKPPHHSKQYSVPQKNEVLEGEEGIATQKVRKQTPKSGSRRRQSKEEYNFAVDTEKTKVASTSHDDTVPIYSSMHSAGAGPSVSRKARKHLSERWQIACQSGSENSIPKGITTLGEMLGLSDGDAAKETSHKGSSDPNFSRCNVREVPASPLGISSKDGWKTGIYCEDDSRGGMSRNFPRSKSLPASLATSTKLSGRRQSAPTCRLPILKDILNTPTDESENAPVRKRSPIRNAKQRNGRAIVHLGKENMLPEKEIHVTSEKARHSICISDLSWASNIYTEKYPDDAIRTGDQQNSDCAVQHDDKKILEGHTGRTYQTLATSFPETKEVLSIQNEDNIALKGGRSPSVEIDIAEVDTLVTQSVSIASGESCECSSPTALSPRSSSEETSYSGIFKSINVGIQELRAQLKMLKMEDQDDTYGDYCDTLSTDECNDMNISRYQVTEEQLPTFKDEEDRDLCYVQDMLASVCDLPDYPEGWQVGSDVFLWLEHKYSKMLLWSKSDRKLLFDLVNSILADMITPDNSLHSKIMINCWPEIDRGQLAENVWQMVQKRSNYEHFALEDVQPLPLDHHSELEVIGMKIAMMIHDDIIKDSIVEFLSQEKYLVSN
ncbi:hypothetical protein BAE44_0023460 [Dichanthelium oligosanthes]|uniref:DUF4378 domain-containing protein n=1 Tax=Dichanthelium oligosanthes TaxID=888268 RepID=A0A1E5URS2_9POAL|nr:hypothetical protein BAE44_0023460 [Dichanthelium oligosanthes]